MSKVRQPETGSASADMSRAEARRRELEADLPRIVDNLVRRYAPQCIILYGSLPNGEVNEWSDLDLCVIKDTEADFMQRARDAHEAAAPRVAIDIGVCTPQEWRHEVEAGNYFVVEEILGRGKILYGKPPGLA